MSVRPVFNIDKPQWMHFRKLFPEFESWLEQFASQTENLPDPVLRVRSILNLLTESDMEVMVYLNALPRPPVLTEDRKQNIAAEIGKKMELIDSQRWEIDVQKPLNLPPISYDSLDTLIPWFLKSFVKTEQGFESTSFYEVLKLKQWLMDNKIPHRFRYLPDYRYLIKIDESK